MCEIHDVPETETGRTVNLYVHMIGKMLKKLCWRQLILSIFCYLLCAQVQKMCRGFKAVPVP